MRSFLFHVLASLWRRKALVLLLLSASVVFMIFLLTSRDGEQTVRVRTGLYNNGQRTLRTFETRGGNISDKLQRTMPSEEHQQPQQLIAVQEEVDPGGDVVVPRVAPFDRRMQEAKSVRVGLNEFHHLEKKDKHDIRPVADKSFRAYGGMGHGEVVELSRSQSRYHHNHFHEMAADAPIAPQSSIFVPQRRLVHLDLKGAPPKISYLEKLIPILKQLGATGLLIEYEDMFPFEGPLKSVAAKNHYSKREVRSLLHLAKQNDLDVIPLVQTFGHLEFLLKLENFKHLREVPAIPQAVCPSRNESFAVIQRLIDQVMDMHEGVRWLHIGCDEVFQLGVCSLCNRHPREDVFLSHVARVARYVRQKYGVTPIVWDDMFHHLRSEQVRKYDLGSLVEPMLWTYVSDIYRFISGNVWSMYAEVFPYIWAASAFKGAFGETLTVPDVKRHLENNMAWVEVLNQERGRFQEIRGIAITGWQRYDHFAVLCELLPAAVPSLAVSLLGTSNGYFNESLQSELFGALQCMKNQKYTTFIDLERDPHLWTKLSWCFFPGVSFFKVTEHLSRLRTSVSDFLTAETINKAWMTEYNIRRNFSSITRIDNTMQEFPRYLYDVETLLKHSRDALREAFDEYTVAEWIEQNVYPLLRKLELLQRAADALKRLNSWPVRPFDTLPDLQRFNIGIPDDNS